MPVQLNRPIGSRGHSSLLQRPPDRSAASLAYVQEVDRHGNSRKLSGRCGQSLTARDPMASARRVKHPVKLAGQVRLDLPIVPQAGQVVSLTWIVS
jgi:hypothetical protein